jgi:hypothetical protein
MDPKGKGMVINDKEKETLRCWAKRRQAHWLRLQSQEKGWEEEEAHKEDHLLRQRCLLLFTKGWRRWRLFIEEEKVNQN